MTTKPITFTPIESFFDTTFWSKFYDHKLEVYKLDESGVPLVLSYTTSPHVNLPPKVSAYGEYSFSTTPTTHLGQHVFTTPTTLINYNSFQSFKESDKKELLHHHTNQIWRDMLRFETTLQQPSALTHNFIISYSDLKQHVYTHWSCFPSIVNKNIQYVLQPQPGNGANVNASGGDDDEYIHALDKHFQYEGSPLSLADWAQMFELNGFVNNLTQQPFFFFDKKNKALKLAAELFSTTNPPTNVNYTTFLEDFALVIVDPQPMKEHFGWFTRNILFFFNLLLAAYDVPANAADNNYTVEVVLIKNFKELTSHYQDNAQTANSLAVGTNFTPITHTSHVYHITTLGVVQEYPTAVDYMKAYRNDTTLATPLPPPPQTTGWEKVRDKAQPKQTTAKNMDPLAVYTQAMDMNLKLLKWQHWPEMELQHIRNQRCLLVGSGTLGCYVSRLLLGWGVKNITMLDSGFVSPSNPVRQPLFTYEDWVNKKYKANAACDALKKIHPGANLTPAVLSIPSAGAVSQKELPEALASVEKLVALIKECDVVFLLTDSRASRWLPTLLAQAYGKRTIAAAIGPDSFVAMRHGVRQRWFFNLDKNTTEAQQPEDLARVVTSCAVTTSGSLNCGCYFCTDQAAPILGIPQSIDQQCTVTRAEVAALASAYAVNLFVQEVSHDCTHRIAPTQQQQQQQQQSTADNTEADVEAAVGVAATVTTCGCEKNSQIRGTVLTNLSPVVETNSVSLPPSNTCVACGDKIIEAYQTDPTGFLTAAFLDAENVVTMSGFNPSFMGGDWENDDWDGSDLEEGSGDDF